MMRNKFWAAAALAIAIGTFAGSGVVHAESMPKDTVAVSYTHLLNRP